jgi:GMP synthase-like glutamine amidotransferase
VTAGRVAVVQHVAHEGPGVIADALAGAGLEPVVVRLDEGAPLPEVGDLAGLVVLGGPMGVHDDGAYPWLAAERVLLADAVSAGIGVLGICLGAQQLAAALGAGVTAGRAPEVGLGSVVLTAAGRRDPLFGPEYGGLALPDVPCVHWHADTFELPDGAVHLAATRAYPHQAFRVGARAYGLQFHLEVDAGLAAAWSPHLPAGAALDPLRLAEVTATGRRVLGRFAGLVAGEPVGAHR